MGDYDLFQPSILDKLRQGATIGTYRVEPHEWFALAMRDAYADVAHAYNCEIIVSERRLHQVHKLWITDLTNIKIESDAEPDVYKQAGHLAYWLRRRVVVAIVQENVVEGDLQAAFLETANEVCAFVVGYWICLFYLSGSKSGVDREELIESSSIDPGYIMDAGTLLYKKEMSPGAMYMLYRSLFYDIQSILSVERREFVLKPIPGGKE